MEKLPFPPQKTKPIGDEVRAAEICYQAMNLYRQGNSFRTVGKKLGISDKTAAKWIRKCLFELAALSKASAEEYRALELARLSRLWAGIIKQAESGNLWAVDRAISIITLRCKILGLEKPASLVIAGDRNNPLTVEHHQHDIGKRLLERMTRLAEGREVPGDLAPSSSPSDEIIDITPPVIPGD
jgi:hypothetical protein